MPVSPPLEDIHAEAIRLVRAAQERGLAVKLLGGAAVAARCESAREAPLARECKDIDLVARRRDRGELVALLEETGYEAHSELNALYGGSRLVFFDRHNDRQVDVLLDRFEMCHALDLTHRLEGTDPALDSADLLLTKLQVRETNERDLKDAVALLGDGEVDVARVTEILAADWGWWRTTTEVLGRVRAYAETLDAPVAEHALAQIDRLEAAIDRAPKSVRWRARARVGERLRWFEEPDDDY